MKKQIIITIFIFVLGFAIFLGMFIFGREKGFSPAQNKPTLLSDEALKNISTSEPIDLTQKESEQFDETQLYFENGEKLYDFFNVLDSEVIKSKISDYVLSADKSGQIKDVIIKSVEKEQEKVILIISAETLDFKLIVTTDKGIAKSMIIENILK